MILHGLYRLSQGLENGALLARRGLLVFMMLYLCRRVSTYLLI